MPSSMVAKWLRKIDEIQDKREKERISHAVQAASGTALFAGYETVSDRNFFLGRMF